MKKSENIQNKKEIEKEISRELDTLLLTVSQENGNKLKQNIYSMLKPYEKTEIIEWCEKNLYLPQEVTATPGYYSAERTPYVKAICEALSPNSQYNEVIFCGSVQIGKTQLLLNNLCFNICTAPANIIFGFSNTNEKDNFVQSRLNPLIDANPNLKNRIFSKRARETGDTKRMKKFIGGTLYFASGETADGWRSNFCRYAFIDEVDAMPINVQGEGSPVDLARRRTTTFDGIQKIFICSTPTNGVSRILTELRQTDQKHYFVPCPHCGHFHEIEWERMQWDANGTNVKKAFYTCPKCGAIIYNSDKTQMLKNGEWRSTNTEETSPTKTGFYITGLYSPFMSWEKVVTLYLEAVKKNLESDLISFYNTILARQYAVQSATPEWKNVYNISRTSDWKMGEVPNDCVLITTGSDVQIDRIETYVYGWTKHGRAKLINQYAFTCESNESTKDLNAKCYKEWYQTIYSGVWVRQDGIEMRSLCNAMDRNYNTATINAFWEQVNDNKHFILVRGDDKLSMPISTIMRDIPSSYSVKARSLNKQRTQGVFYYYHVGSSYLKREFYHALKTEDNEEHTTSGLYFFPNDISEETCKQLTAEVYIEPDEKHKNGYWKKIRDRNEALDCTNYATACFYHLNMHKLSTSEWDELEKMIASKSLNQGTEKGNRLSIVGQVKF